MSAELRERLGDLADQVPTTPPPPDLWDRGRRYGRRRTLTQVAVASCCLLLLAVGVSTAWSQLNEPEFPPARGDAPVYLPDRFYNASPWLPGTDDEGPLGRLVAVIGAERKTWTSHRNALVGVSASTGAYRFLDLPGYGESDLVDAPPPVLSADGRWLAYPVTGATSGEPNTPDGEDPIVGVAVYDAITGELHRHRWDTKHGLMLLEFAFAGSKLWVSSSRWVEPGNGGGRGVDQPTLVWDLSSAEKVEVRQPEFSFWEAGAAPSGFIVVGDKGFRVLRQPKDAAEPEVRHDSHIAGSLSVDASGRRVAGVWGGPDPATVDNRPRSILVGNMPDGAERRVKLRRVPGTMANRVLGWRNENEVVVQNNRSGAWLESVDVRTGETRRLTRVSDQPWTPGTLLATDILAAPVVDGKEPPRPWDPRLVIPLITGVALAGVAGLGALARRHRARA